MYTITLVHFSYSIQLNQQHWCHLWGRYEGAKERYMGATFLQPADALHDRWSQSKAALEHTPCCLHMCLLQHPTIMHQFSVCLNVYLYVCSLYKSAPQLGSPQTVHTHWWGPVTCSYRIDVWLPALWKKNCHAFLCRDWRHRLVWRYSTLTKPFRHSSCFGSSGHVLRGLACVYLPCQQSWNSLPGDWCAIFWHHTEPFTHSGLPKMWLHNLCWLTWCCCQ